MRVKHVHKTVRRHFIDLALPPRPEQDEEAFVLRFPTSYGVDLVDLRPADLQQLVNCLQKAINDVTGGHLAQVQPRPVVDASQA